MKSTTNYKLQLGDQAPEFTLTGTDDKDHNLAEFTQSAMVLFFSCNHCPYVHAVEDKVIAFSNEFGDKVDIVAINSNDAVNYPDDSFENMKLRASEKEYNFTYLRDKTQNTAKAYGGLCTPHFFVFDKDKKLAYQGGFDKLKDAVQTLLDQQEVTEPLTETEGCSIKWK